MEGNAAHLARLPILGQTDCNFCIVRS